MRDELGELAIGLASDDSMPRAIISLMDSLPRLVPLVGRTCGESSSLGSLVQRKPRLAPELNMGRDPAGEL